MLYLYGDSGTTYLYIHLNNDLDAKNDNRGKCVAGGRPPRLKDGAHVAAGSRSASSATRATPTGRRTSTSRCTRRTVAAADPFPYLQRATRLLSGNHGPDGRLGAARNPGRSGGGGVLELELKHPRVAGRTLGANPGTSSSPCRSTRRSIRRSSTSCSRRSGARSPP